MYAYLKSIIAIMGLYTLVAGCVKSVEIPNPAYSVGVVDTYNPSNTQSNIQFHFTANSDTIYVSYVNGHNGWEVPKGKDYHVGAEFMVQYNPQKKSEAKMLFCYPVKDSSDYINYVSQFKMKPPSCD